MRVVIKKFVSQSADFAYIDSLIAQLVERRTVNPQVPGSSPGRGAKILKGLCANVAPFLFSVAYLRCVHAVGQYCSSVLYSKRC